MYKKYEKMAVVRLTFILLLQSIFFININCDDFRDNSDDLYQPQIWCLINYLNANPNSLYNYNYGTLINAQNKEPDNTELTIDVGVQCRNREIECDVNLLECTGTVKYNTETANYEVLPGASCSQKAQVESTSYAEQDYSPTEQIESKSEYYINAEPVQEEQFTKKTVPLLGGPMDLNLNIEGLDILTNTALKHIESERNYRPGLVRVVRIQRQIVSGVKYILTLEIAPTNCPKNLETTYSCSIVTSAEPEICEITYYQQPWISHRKNIISNNCTETQEFNEDGINSAANDQDNEIDTNYNPKKPYGYPDQPEHTDHMPVYPNYDVIADTGNADDILKMSGGATIDVARLRDIESQIIQMIDTPKTTSNTNTQDQEMVNTEQDISKVNAENRESFPFEVTEIAEESTTDEMTTENPMLSDAQKAAFDDFMDMMGDQPRMKRGTKNNNHDDDSSSSSSSSEEDDDNNNGGNDKEYEKTKRKNKKYTKKGKHDNNDDNNDDDDDNNNDDDGKKNNKDDDSSSSSSSSSSEEDNNGNGDDNGKDKKHKNKKAKRAANDSSPSYSSEENNENPRGHSSSSSEEANEEDNRTKRQAKPASSESSESSEEKQVSTTVASIAQNLIAHKDKDTSEEKSSEEYRGGVRRKRSLSNDLIKVSPDEKNFVHNLAEFSTRVLDDIDADSHKRVILQVLGAKKNVAGNLYYLTVRVGVSKCPEDIKPVFDLNQEYRKDKCRNKLFENLTKICKVEINVNDDKTVAKVEKSQCQNMKKEQEDSDVNRTNRSMFRSKRGSERLAGGINKVESESSEIQQYVKNVLLELNAKNGVGAVPLEFIKVHEASKQIVSGVLYRFKVEIKQGAATKMCSIHVWDQAWLNPPKEVKITCDGGEEKKYRFRRSDRYGLFGKDDHDVHIGLFKDFMHKHNKQYSSKTEFKNRFRIFKQNMKTIKLLNENEQGTAKYGPTMFADLTNEEYKNYLGLRPELRNNNNIPMPQAVIPDVDVPVEFDWRKKGVISEVKNQGGCGSCWAFSVTGNIEGLNAIKTGNLIELSEQELVDCDTLDSGCNGGLPDNAYRAIEQLGGLETESDYPYEAENEKCVFNKTLTKVQISGAVNISSNETDMAKWLITNGPISIGINANAMQFYMGGVSHPWKFLCNPGNLDHGVLIVGYGTHKYPLFNKVMPYWTIKNSWGPTWGEQGYYRVYRGDGTCGVNMMASSAIL